MCFPLSACNEYLPSLLYIRGGCLTKIMEKLSIQGNCSKENFYKVLDVIDQLKQEGWFIQGKTRNENEKADTVDFNYTLNKKSK